MKKILAFIILVFFLFQVSACTKEPSKLSTLGTIMNSTESSTSEEKNIKEIKMDSLSVEADKLVIDELKSIVYNKEDSVIIQIGKDVDYNFAISVMFLGVPYKFLCYAQEVNNQVDDKHQIDVDNINFIELEAKRAVIVNITYK